LRSAASSKRRRRDAGIAFLLEHEAYHIGQLGLLRKLYDLGPMKYD